MAALRENPFADVPATPSTPKVKGGQTILCTEEALGANTSSFPDLLKGLVCLIPWIWTNWDHSEISLRKWGSTE